MTFIIKTLFFKAGPQFEFYLNKTITINGQIVYFKQFWSS